jgi:quercetin 2,3-dioxygenase
MTNNELPGNKTPYKIDAGQGLRYAFGSQLACVIARPEDLGQPMFGAVLSGAKGAAFPPHRHKNSHEAWFVLEGVVTLLLGDKEYRLTPGCYANIPAGTPHGFTYEEHRSRVLTWTFGGGANRLYQSLGSPYPGTVHPETGDAPDWRKLDEAVDSEVLEAVPTSPGFPASASPRANAPFVLAPYEGERMLAAEQLYTFLGTNAHSEGNFISLLTEGPIGPEIPRHYHDAVTETFFCIKGALQMFVNDEYIQLDAGDFLHVPPGAVHSFKIARDDTRFIGFLTPGIFENFFRYLCQPFDGHIYPLVPPPFRFDRVLQHMGELDLHMVGGPGPPAGPGAA